MLVLAIGKRRAGRALDSRAILADAAESTCALLSGATILGVGLNAAFRWHWADPVAGLVISALALNEGREAFQDEHVD